MNRISHPACGGDLSPLWADVQALAALQPEKKKPKPNDHRSPHGPRPSAPIAPRSSRCQVQRLHLR